MPATLDVARDEIYGALKATWDADTPAVNGGLVPELFYDGVPRLLDPAADVAYAEIYVRHSGGRQASLAGELGRRRFTKSGIVTVAVFAPIVKAGGLTLADELAKVAKKAFEGKATASAVWFRNVRAVEVGVTAAWYHVNVFAEFEYDEFV